MSEEELSGEEMLSQNMEAFEEGENLPHEEEINLSSEDADDVAIDEAAQDDLEEHEEEDAEEPERDKRHISKEDWVASGKDPDAYLTPNEFDRAGDLKSESNLQLAKRLAQQETMMREMLSNQQKALDENTKRAQDEILDKLKAEQSEALEFGDSQKAVDIERKINQQETVNKPVDNAPQTNPDIQSFYDNNNDWYDVDQGATGLLNVQLQRAQKKGLPFSDAIGPAMEKVKSQFHYLFDGEEAPAKSVAKKNNDKPLTRPRQVSEKSRPAAKSKAKRRSFSELEDPLMRDVAMKMAKSTGVSEQEYMESM